MADTDEGALEAVEGDGAEDSSVIEGFRDRERDLKRRLKEAEVTLEQAAENARVQVTREIEARRLVDEAGYPKLADIVLEKVEGDMTEESVQGALNELGLNPTQDGEQAENLPPDLEEVANLGSSLDAAVKGQSSSSVDDQLASAQSSEQVTEIMRDAGLLQ